MSFLSLCDDLCDIYHLKDKSTTGSFGLPGRKKLEYDDEPDLKNISCHFNAVIKQTNQQDPENIVNYERKLNLPIDTEIKVMDKIIDKSTGIVYTTSIVDNIRGHHIAVGIKKMEEYL